MCSEALSPPPTLRDARVRSFQGCYWSCDVPYPANVFRNCFTDVCVKPMGCDWATIRNTRDMQSVVKASSSHGPHLRYHTPCPLIKLNNRTFRNGVAHLHMSWKGASSRGSCLPPNERWDLCVSHKPGGAVITQKYMNMDGQRAPRAPCPSSAHSCVP